MTLFKVTPDKLEPVAETSFAAENLLERKDLQRLLRRDISPIGEDLMVIAEEFGDWEESNRRIDLLCLTKDASLAVVEIKRTADGGHMELQAIRYAAMVSSMTLDQAIGAYARMRGGDLEAARAEVLYFLRLASEDEAELSGDVRIILVSADFSTELTTAVLWLNKRDLDVTCIRLLPYRIGSDVFVDAAQIIPLPEAEDYGIKIKALEQEKRKVAGVRQEILRRFWAQYIERSLSRTQLLANRTATKEQWLGASTGRSGLSLTTVLTQHDARVECYIDLQGEANTKAAFRALLTHRDDIEAAFGGPLDWQELPGRRGCRICKALPGGWKSPEVDWPEMQDRLLDALVRLEAAFKKPIQNLHI